MSEQSFGSIQLDAKSIQQVRPRTYKIAALSQVDGVAVGYQHYPALIWLAVLSFAGGALFLNDEKGYAAGLVLALVGLLTLILYFATRRSQLVVHAGLLAFHESITGSSHAKAVAFAQQVRAAQGSDALSG